MDAENYGWGRALVAGAAGALALTAVHQLARRLTHDAPRMDLLAMRGMERAIAAGGGEPPPREQLFNWALAGDLMANSAYYALIAYGREPHVWRRATALGLAAGAGALVLPRHVGLGDPPRSHSVANQIMTVAWYLVGGLAAAGAAKATRRTAA